MERLKIHYLFTKAGIIQLQKQNAEIEEAIFQADRMILKRKGLCPSKLPGRINDMGLKGKNLIYAKKKQHFKEIWINLFVIFKKSQLSRPFLQISETHY